MDIASASAVVSLKINSLEPVDALVNNSLASLAASSDSKTVSIATTEVLVASKAAQGIVTLGGNSGPASRNSEVIIQLIEQATGSVIQSRVILMSPGRVRNQSLAEVKTLTLTGSSKVVAVLATDIIANRVSNFTTLDRDKVSVKVLTRVLSTSGNFNLASPRLIDEFTTAPDLSGPGSLLRALMITQSNINAFSIQNLDSESDRLLFRGLTSIEVVLPSSLRNSSNNVGIRLNNLVVIILSQHNVIGDRGVIKIL
jgi:hypothetical protein